MQATARAVSREAVKQYWTERAASDSTNTTTNDVHLRHLERATLVKHLRDLGCSAQSRLLDAGCGDGLTIATLAQEFGCDLVGRDFAPSMINLARVRLAAQPSLRADLAVGDVCRVVEEFGAESFDFITTDRCLVNMASESQQYAALAAISAALKPGGFYLGIENFIEGNERLNAMRALFGLPPIAIRWHNNFFRESEFVERARHSFRSVEKHEFSSAYYFATRVVYSKVCAVEGVEPDYRHAVHAESVKLPTFGDFSPTKLFVLGK